jgi:glycosyltransferase involved in cell wall biosynthesis
VLKVAYLANQFPSAVEPYVGQEIDALRRRGVEVHPGSVRRSHIGSQSPAQTLDAEIIFLQPIRVLVVLKATWLLIRRWRRIAGLLQRVILQGKESPLRRLKALAHTGLGACYAVLLNKRKVNHIHVHHGYFGSWIAMVAARLLEVDFSMTLHGSDLLLHNAYLDTKLKHCRFCVTISQYNRRYILEHFPVGPEKVIVSRLGVDVPGETAVPGDRSSSRRFTLVAVGRLHAVKDHAVLVRACARLRDRGIDLECLIAGEGPERQRLESLIRKCRLEQQVSLLGQIPPQQMDSLYRRADVVVLTSASEGLPLVLMEAMARGKIVLAPAITGIPELVIPGKTGFLYEPGSLDDLVARLFSIHALMHREDRPLNRLSWIRHAARWQVLHNFNRKTNLEYFVGRFVELAAGNRSFPHADHVLQQIQLPLQRDRGVPVRGHGIDAVEGAPGRAVFHGRSARQANAV